MRGFGAALVAAAGLALGAVAVAQQAATAAQIAVLEGDAPGEYRALGVVSVETHQKSLFPKTPARQQLDEALRAEAAKLGADAVIQVTYKIGNAMMSKAGNHATGVAVKFSRPPTQMAAAPAPAPAAPVQAAAAPAPAPSPTSAPVVIAAAPLVAAQPTMAPAPPKPVVVAGNDPAPGTADDPQRKVIRATTPAMILLSDQDVPGRPYERIGEVSAVTHQKSIFPKTPPLETLKSALQAEAHKLGADAVIQVRYKMGNAITSTDGNRASGVAVRFE